MADPRPGSGWGLFGPDSLTWRVNRESVLLAGGGRALILQVAQPQVAAGVAQHSDYRTDPWGRLYRTLDVTLRIVFGDEETSTAAASALHDKHKRVQGADHRGEPYYALNPELIMWVHATLVDTSLLVYDRYVGRLSERDKAVYYEEQMRLGEVFGVPIDRQPPDYAAFRDYWREMLADGLEITDTLRDVTDAVTNPSLPFVARPVVDALNLVTVGTLPPELRQRLGLRWGPARERLLGASQFTIRRLMPVLPGLVRSFPPARAASRRAA